MLSALDRALARLQDEGLRGLANRYLSVSTDICEGDPAALTLREAALRGDWPAVRAFLAGVADSNARYFYLRVVARAKGAERWLDQVVRANPADTLALLVYGHRLIAWAWEARGSGAAFTVSDMYARVFRTRLGEAEAYLGEVVSRNPGDADAWAGLITCNRGLQRGLDEAWRRFNGSRAADANHWGAHAAMLQQLCGKWGGDDQMMHRFAVESAAAAAEGSPVTCLVPEAHIEIWVGGAGQKYIRRPEVIEEIRKAAAWGPNSPAYRPFAGDAVVHNLFARAFMNAKLPSEAAPHFAAAGSRVVELVWADAGYLWPASLIHLSYLGERARARR
ncbi:hypothetical protein Acy02nite_28090 [Actinoplanes cyaneus]|uniref:DUF4034 domain-containing protein n=1 Tax=Actinoplanes cyaneus TaxID=52696 RepID=A0A919M570_9ACTN|nr:hypothetical protein [Actinoplanes cyaneus]MCW2137865.1 hypothetical protein [Actinoplanes cyaneus]GID64928.1 hypothetical protein Acy02nite_28090 [Actinoplanes cyaneus]